MAIQALRHGEAFEPLFAVQSQDKDGCGCVLVSGELDLATVPLLEQEIERVEQRGSKVATLDLRGLWFMDVAGLRCIMRVAAEAEKDGRPLDVVGAGIAVRKVFELTGAAGVLTKRPSLRAVDSNGDGRG
jgi:anti-sigma B factor antagonist